jgi:hypothetical protein
MVITLIDGFNPDGCIARVTGKIAGCAPKAKIASGNTDMALPKFTNVRLFACCA